MSGRQAPLGFGELLRQLSLFVILVVVAPRAFVQGPAATAAAHGGKSDYVLVARADLDVQALSFENAQELPASLTAPLELRVRQRECLRAIRLASILILAGAKALGNDEVLTGC